jgi:APA family basic amino acid/polyamine antiporter
LTLFDLVCVGIGSTIGSGIFVLCGLIANQYAGPATFISWGIAGGAACLSGVCYAELAGKIPTAGSVYAYSYVSMGELPAVMAAACLTLEYVGSASAVARSWGDKVVEYVYQEFLMDINGEIPSDPSEQTGTWWWIMKHVLNPGYGINPMAFIVSTASVILLLQGVKESKAATNFFTTVNVALVTFMGVGGLVLLQRNNLLPLVPPQFGAAGIFRGATSSFFGYIGYDEICCIAGEALNPRQNLPRAILLTLCIVTFLYMVAALALTGMQPYEEISCTSGFPNAFRSNGVEWAAQLTAVSIDTYNMWLVRKTLLPL